MTTTAVHVKAQQSTNELWTEEFWRWLEQEEPRLFTIASCLMADQDAAIEVVEDSILQVFISAGGTSSGPGLAKALDLAVASTALGWRKDYGFDAGAGARPPSGGGQPLVVALWGLPGRLRCPLVLRDMCNLSYDEICGLLGESRETVSQCIAEARHAFLGAGVNTSSHVMAGKVG